MTTIPTTLPHLLPTVRALSRSDKLRLIQFLAVDLAQEEGISLLEGASYPVWSPYDASDAAATLMRELEAEGMKP